MKGLSVSNKIRATHLYQSGDRFAVSQMANALKESMKITQGNITTMMSAGEIVVATKSTKGTTYRKSAKNPVISMPWRKRSNEKLGVEPLDMLGGWGYA